MEKRGIISLAATAALLLAFAAYAQSATYDDMGEMAGVCNGFWDTTGRTAISVGSAASAAVTMNTLTWTSAESSPAIRMNTKPYIGFRVFVR